MRYEFLVVTVKKFAEIDVHVHKLL